MAAAVAERRKPGRPARGFGAGAASDDDETQRSGGCSLRVGALGLRSAADAGHPVVRASRRRGWIRRTRRVCARTAAGVCAPDQCRGGRLRAAPCCHGHCVGASVALTLAGVAWLLVSVALLACWTMRTIRTKSPIF